MHPLISPERLVMFSDGVFAIAITILALELHLPDSAYHGDLAAALIGSGPKVMSFAISFMVIALFWRAHLRAFNWIAHADTRLITLNLLLLMLVCFLPFPTAVLGDAGTDPAAVVFYALSVAAASLAQLLTWVYAAIGTRLIQPETPRAVRHMIAWRSLIPCGVFVISAIIAWAGHPSAAMYTWIAILPLFWVLRIIASRQW
jgi:uncharacterized membrane protein